MKRFVRGINKSSTGSDINSFEMYEPKLVKKRIYLAPPVKHNCIKHNVNGNSESIPAKKRRKQISSKINRHIFIEDQFEDDDDGHLNFNVNDILDKYSLLGYLGKGTFSRVAKVRNIETLETCALKIVRNTDGCRKAGNLEVEMLKRLRGLDPNGEKLWIKMLDYFEYQGHICIALELTGSSLYDFMRDNQYQPYTLSQTRQIAYQICKSIKALHDNFIVHTDLKPENICFVSSDFSYGIRSTRNTSYRKVINPTIRVIDFGSAELCYGLNNSHIQTRNYRAPEVIFDLGWSKSCDVWSIACIVFELYHGSLLFPAEEDDELADTMQDVLGPLPDMYISHCLHRQHQIGINTQGLKRSGCKPLHKYMKVSNNEHRQLFDLLGKFLKYKPHERITLSEALDHQFFSL